MRRKILGGLFVVIAIVMACSNVWGAEPFYNITGIYLRSDEAEIGSKLYVDLYLTGKSENTDITGFFLNDSLSYVSLPLRDVNTNNPYFEISSQMQAGSTYKMTALEVSDAVDDITYSLTPGGENYMNALGKNVVSIKKQVDIVGFSLLGDKNIKENGSVKLELRTDQEVGLATVGIQNKNVASSKALVAVKANAETAIDLSRLGSQRLPVGEYRITDVFLNPDNVSKYVHFSVNPQDDTTKPLLFDVEFNIVNDQGSTKPETVNENNDLLQGIKLLKTEAGLNEKVGVEINTSKSIIFATLIFSNNEESMTVNLKDLDSVSPFFVVPFTTGEGKYELDYLILKDEDGKKYQYRKGEDYYGVKHFDFNSSIEVKNEISDGELLNLDNNKITNKIIEKIAELDDNIVIEINCNDDPIISKELFEAIKGSNKTIVIVYDEFEWVFNGLDIVEPKQIDVGVKSLDVNDRVDLFDQVQEGIVIEFPENGELPGKCLIRVYNTDYISNVLDKSNANVYYYNDPIGKFEVVELDLAYNDKGFYEFYISHNSSYVLTRNRIDDSFLLSNEGKSNGKVMMYVIIALIGVLMILMVSIGVMMVKMKKSKVVAQNDGTMSENQG